jgi:Holliday junction resolvasome RuvABC endonuclease subunit
MNKPTSRRTNAVIPPVNNSPVILAHDPSITAWGWVVIQGTEIKAAGCIKTSSESKARRIRKGDDRVRRVSEIVQQLHQVIKDHRVTYMVSELPHGSQSAVAAVMVGICAGVVQTMADILDIGVEWFSEGDAKQTLVKKRSATKLEIKEAVAKLYPGDYWTGIGYRDEAIADSLAVYNVFRKTSPVARL